MSIRSRSWSHTNRFGGRLGCLMGAVLSALLAAAACVVAQPVAPVAVDLEAASDSGLASDDNITNIATGTVDITAAAAGVTIRVYRSGVLLGQATVVSDVAYSYTFAAGQLQEGDNSITARSFDGTTESADSPALHITLDRTPPRIVSRSPRGAVDITGQDLSSVQFSFNERVIVDAARPDAMDLANVSITGPEGTITPAGLSQTNATDFTVTFAPTTTRGHEVAVPLENETVEYVAAQVAAHIKRTSYKSVVLLEDKELLENRIGNACRQACKMKNIRFVNIQRKGKADRLVAKQILEFLKS